MSKEKWLKIWNEETTYNRNMPQVNSPEDWLAMKQGLVKVIKVMDEATEVYKMENKEKI